MSHKDMDDAEANKQATGQPVSYGAYGQVPNGLFNWEP